MKYFTTDNQEITTKIEVGSSSYFPGHNTTSFTAALNFSNAIKNELIEVYNVYGIIVGYAVSN